MESFIGNVLTIIYLIILFLPIYFLDLTNLSRILIALISFVYLIWLLYLWWRRKNTLYIIDKSWNIVNKKWFYSIQEDFSYLKKSNIDELSINLLEKDTEYKFLNYMNWKVLVSRFWWILWNTRKFNVLDKNFKLVFDEWVENNETFLIERIVDKFDDMKNK